jgi:hypothetical protein
MTLNQALLPHGLGGEDELNFALAHHTSIDMNIARYMVFLVLGLLLGILLSSLASWLMG